MEKEKEKEKENTPHIRSEIIACSVYCEPEFFKENTEDIKIIRIKGASSQEIHERIKNVENEKYFLSILQQTDIFLIHKSRKIEWEILNSGFNIVDTFDYESNVDNNAKNFLKNNDYEKEYGFTLLINLSINIILFFVALANIYFDSTIVALVIIGIMVITYFSDKIINKRLRKKYGIED